MGICWHLLPGFVTTPRLIWSGGEASLACVVDVIFDAGDEGCVAERLFADCAERNGS